jgi:hypothetical protein
MAIALWAKRAKGIACHAAQDTGTGMIDITSRGAIATTMTGIINPGDTETTMMGIISPGDTHANTTKEYLRVVRHDAPAEIKPDVAATTPSLRWGLAAISRANALGSLIAMAYHSQ